MSAPRADGSADAPSGSEPRTLVDPTTGRPILMAPQRQQRPMHTGDQQHQKPCPFCAGHEHLTPPETDAERPDGSRPDTPGWLVRAFANKYPAARHHEVIAEGAVHHEHPGDLDQATWRSALALWRRRIVAMEAHDDVAHAYWFKNVGASAGASIAHNHSQIIGLERLPPRLELELAERRRLDGCPWCATLASAAEEDRLIYDNAAFAVVAPEPPKMPFETWLLPRRCDDDFLTTDLDRLAEAVHVWFQALERGLDRCACNLWLHRVPPTVQRDTPFHWHFELQPRTGQLAGLELGGDMYINSVPSQLTAQRLRGGLPGT